MKKKFISDLIVGERVDDLFVLAEKSMGQKRDGNPFLNITLADRTGRIKCVAWDIVDQITAEAVVGDFVRVSALIGEYRGSLQLVIKRLEKVDIEAVEPGDFLPATSRNIDQMFSRLKTLTNTMRPDLRSLMDAFWQDEAFVKAFTRAPAGKHMHHAYIGGLLEHTLSMAMLTDKVANHYSGVDRDLLLAGAVLHDIGKVRELNYSHSIDYSDEGRLLSHIVIGIEMVEERIRLLNNFSQDQAVLIKHMIVSHHGARELGSPEPPKTMEAVLLNYIDEIDSRVNAIREFMAIQEPEATWTPYHRLLERHFFKGTSDDTGG